MSNNKLHNRSYFCKRLREEGIDTTTLVVYDKGERRMPASPERRWTVACSPADIIVTCYKKDEDFWFRMETSDSWNTIIRTQSMKVVSDIIKGCIDGTNPPADHQQDP